MQQFTHNKTVNYFLIKTTYLNVIVKYRNKVKVFYLTFPFVYMTK